MGGPSGLGDRHPGATILEVERKPERVSRHKFDLIRSCPVVIRKQMCLHTHKYLYGIGGGEVGRAGRLCRRLVWGLTEERRADIYVILREISPPLDLFRFQWARMREVSYHADRRRAAQLGESSHEPWVFARTASR